jgi:amino acid permease
MYPADHYPRYAYCCAFSALIVGAGSLLQYFNISSVLLNIVYGVSMLVIFLINCCGVRVFGEIEFWGGILKLFIVLGVFVLMCCINAGGLYNILLPPNQKLIVGSVNTEHSIGSIRQNTNCFSPLCGSFTDTRTAFIDGVRNNPNVAATHATAVL